MKHCRLLSLRTFPAYFPCEEMSEGSSINLGIQHPRTCPAAMEHLDNTDLKQELAHLAARHIAEEGLSYQEAKRKAAKQTGIAEHHAAMPANELIETALREYFAVFVPQQAHELRQLRQLASQWLNHLNALQLDFATLTQTSQTSQASPTDPTIIDADNRFADKGLLTLLVGAVANGTACEHSPVHIHVFTDEFKHLEIALLNAHIVLEHTEKKVDGSFYPVLVAQDAGVPIALTILPKSHYAPPKRVAADEHAQALTLAQLTTLLQQTA